MTDMRVGCLILDCEDLVEEPRLLKLKNNYSVKVIYTYNKCIYKDFCEKHNIELKEVSSHRDYLIFRKDFFTRLQHCFTEENKLTRSLFDLCQYNLLFENEIVYHKIWLIEKVLKKTNYQVIYYSDKSDLSSEQREELFPKEIIKIFDNQAKPAFKSDYLEFYREQTRRIKHFSIKNNIGVKKADKYFFVEYIDNNIKIGRWFKTNSKELCTKTSIINLNYNSSKSNADLNYYSPGIRCYISSLIEASYKLLVIRWSLKFNTFENNKAFKKQLLQTLRPIVLDMTYFSKYAKLLIKKTAITAAISTNYSSIFSRVFSDVCNRHDIKTVYLQHGLLECLHYLMDFKQKSINLWGMIYFPFIKEKETKKILLGNILDCIKNIEKETYLRTDTNESIKKILFLPSRTGGNIVSVAENKYMFDILTNAVKSLNKKQNIIRYKVMIKLHPNDSKSHYAFDSNEDYVTITTEHNSKFWISYADICIAANSTAGMEICYYLKPFIYYTTSKSVTITDTYERYNVGLAVNTTIEMEKALTDIEYEHGKVFTQNMKKFNADFAQDFELEKFEEFVSK